MNIFLAQAFRATILVFALGGLSACTILPGLNLNPESDLDRRDLELGYIFVPITPPLIQSLAQRERSRRGHTIDETALPPLVSNAVSGFRYELGPGDVVQVVVWDHPELTNPGNNLGDSANSGRKIDAQGRMFYPYVGTFRAQGMTPTDLREFIGTRLARVIRDPQVDVRVTQFRSQRVFVSGAVNEPGVVFLDDVPRGLLDVINERGGLSERASLKSAILSRDQANYLIDLEALFSEGDNSQNVAIQAGDVVYVPDNSAEKVFVMGEVERQGSIPIQQRYMTLTEAIASAEGMDMLTANDAAVFVFRSGTHHSLAGICGEGCDPDEPMVFGLDMSRADGVLLADRFRLQPRDVVYVAATDFARYNRIISQILPTVSTVFQIERLVTSD